MFLLLMGPQGSGKGTQADVLVPKFNLIKISTGDLFRAEIASGSDLGSEVKGFLDRGELVPDDVTLRVVEHRLESIEDENAAGAVFDGFPRTLTQAVGLDELLKQRGEAIEHVIEILVPDDLLVRRLSGRRVCSDCGAVFHLEFNPPAASGKCDKCSGELIQRSDDTAESIRRRLDLYEQMTFPLLEYYRPRGIVQSVDGDGSIEEVGRQVEAALAQPARK